MTVCDYWLWYISRLSSSALVLSILGLWAFSRLLASTGQVLSPGAPEVGPPVVPAWFSGCPGLPAGKGRDPHGPSQEEKGQPSH